MKLIYLGTPEFAAPSLKSLAEAGFEVLAVVCRADKPAGRGLQQHEPPVKRLACSLGIPVLQPRKLKKNPELQEELAALKPDVMVVVAYGLLVPKWLLELAPAGCVNVHGSVLPRLRGAAPIQHAILQGFETTGISLMQLDEGMDTGPVFHVEEVPVQPGETAGELHDRLAALAARVLPEVLPRIVRGEIEARPQDDSAATYAPKPDPQLEAIDWTRPAPELDRIVRALSPRPGAFTLAGGRRLKVLRCRPVPLDGPSEGPGSIVSGTPDRLLVVACGEGALEVLEVQPEGKRVMPTPEYLAGHRFGPGYRLGETPDGGLPC